MARVIKFRVSKGQETIGYEMISDGQWFASDHGVNWANGSYAGPRLKRWQYTGRQDVKGVQIYEGDILDYVRDYGPRDRRVVEWVEKPYYSGWNFGKSARFEVAGNVYENPEEVPMK
jgi:hypothetical protein